ncbi:uncharacterized protein LOC106077001 [Biomphalaria glabrata]|uniref:Uncharacterized protein LOC106077001 n=1 Tax=Biomphalaria glabrata TaxID=6526 RepID=A0A9U8ELF0_BIOGL|nr:uncharacterized protein LOC106077001 [Biomphalaria glabrata]
MVTGRGSDNIPIMAGTANFEELLKALHSIRTKEKLTSTLGIENTAAPFATLTQGNIIRSPSSAPTVINEAESSVSSAAPDTTSHNSLSTSSDATPIGSASSASSAKVEQNADSKRKCPTYSELGIVTERPKRPEYAVKGEHSKTFTNWPRSHHIQADDLADAEFYYAGNFFFQM